MAKTKFYLGYEFNNQLTSLSILDNNFQLIDTDLTDVIDYTTLYNNEDELKAAMKNGPMQIDIPEGAKIVYLAATNNPNYPYKKVLGLDHICYASSAGLLEPDTQAQYFVDNRFDTKLIANLYLVVLKCMISINQLKSLYTEEDRKNNSAEKMISVFERNRKVITNANNYILSFMDEIYLQCLEANRRGPENYETDTDRLDLVYLIRRLYESLTTKKDKNGNIKHNQNNGKIERSSRIVGYLALLISKNMMDKYNEYTKEEYEEYVRQVYEELAQEAKEREMYKSNDVYMDLNDSDNHDEEFLTSEDFEALGQDAESDGYRFRGNA